MKYKNWVKLELIDLPKFGGGGLSPTPALSFALSSLIIEKTWLKLVMLENLQACFLLLSNFGHFPTRNESYQQLSILSSGSGKKVSVEENKQILTHTNLALVQIA